MKENADKFYEAFMNDFGEEYCDFFEKYSSRLGYGQFGCTMIGLCTLFLLRNSRNDEEAYELIQIGIESGSKQYRKEKDPKS